MARTIPALYFEGIPRALANPSYRLYASGNSVSLVGFWLQKVAVGWLTWELTSSAMWLGIVAIADVLPAIVLAPLTGVLADRFERIRAIRWTQLAQTLQAATLAALSFTGWVSIESLLSLVLIVGIIQAVAQPVRLSLVPSLVKVEDVGSAVALNSSLFNLARFVGPALAGFLITAFGVSSALAAAAICFFLFLLVMLRVEPLRNEVTPSEGSGIFEDVAEGLRYSMAHPGVGPVLVLIIASTVFARSFFDLLPAFSDVVFDRGAEGLATLVAATGVGALVSSLWLAGRGHPAGLTRIGVGSLAIVAVAEGAFATTTSFVSAIVAMVVVGFATVATSITCQTLLQNTVDGHVRGRVMSIYGLAMRAGPAGGALALGALSERFGLQEAVLGSALCAGLAWIWAQARMRHWASLLERTPS